MENKQIDLITKQLAVKYNLTEAVIDRIIYSQFKFLSEEMISGEMNPIMLQHIGKWYVPVEKKNYYKYGRGSIIKQKNADGTNSIKWFVWTSR